MDRLKRIVPFLKPLLILGLFAVALRVLQDTLAHYHYHQIVVYISSLPHTQIILAVALTFLGYLVMTGYDTLAFRYIRKGLRYRKIALASFIGYAFNNNIGHFYNFQGLRQYKGNSGRSARVRAAHRPACTARRKQTRSVASSIPHNSRSCASRADITSLHAMAMSPT